MSRIILFNKPFDVLCQFTDGENRKTLADFIQTKNVYAAGRLDRGSEGLVVLTDDGQLQHTITDPKHKLPKTYWVQVENIPDQNAVQQLRDGLMLNDGITLPAQADLIDEPENVWPRTPPIRERKNIPTAWLAITITEGRNRQIRRMCAAVNHPALRLIRYSIGEWTIQGLKNGASVEIKTQ